MSIEFAILAPVFFAILFGILAFGLQYTTRIGLSYAAAEGGRAAVAGLSKDERASLAETAIRRVATSLYPLVDVQNVTVECDEAAVADGTELTINVNYTDARFIRFPFLPELTSSAPVSVSYLIADPAG